MPSPPPLFAFGWANLPMLGWLAAAAVPILIHLWSRRKYREMPWAAMEYLLAAARRQTRRLRFEQWLLLAIRTLLVVLVVLAVAEPYTERAGLALTAGGHAHRVLVLDGSYSMAYRPTDKTRFRAGQGTGPADRRRESAGRRLHAGVDVVAAAGGGGRAGPGTRRDRPRDRQPSAAADHRRPAGHHPRDPAGRRRRPARQSAAGPARSLLSDRLAARDLGAEAVGGRRGRVPSSKPRNWPRRPRCS